ncbi:cytochrome P450 [Spirillospora sp. NPDC047279]|uniref:cytochrome P450 n=1 Tax=Spirillospora sp. NPDC047279 TaxID=3155478 RepID=UPI0033E9C6B1
MEDTAFEALDALQRDPYALYARAREADGVTFVRELGAWLVARHADARAVLSDPDTYSSANAIRPDAAPSPAALAELAKGISGGPVAVTADGEAHLDLRAPLTRGLSGTRVTAVVPFILERAESLVGEFAADGRAELMARYARRLPGDVLGRLLGLDPADARTAVHGGRQAERLLFRPLDVDEQVAAARDVVRLQHLLDAYAHARRIEPRDDLISEIVQGIAPGSGDLDPDQRGQVVANLQNLVIAGHLTTAALIGTTVLRLLRHRDRWERLCAHPEVVPAAVEEVARHDTVVQGFRRVTTRPATLAGTELPAGAEIFVAFAAANRDPEVHERPDEFDIDRPPSRHLAFGHGVHACPGAQLGREQVRITLETLSRRLPGLRLDPGSRVTMLPTMIHRSPERLDLVWDVN